MLRSSTYVAVGSCQDKDKVNQYKADIKAQLTRAGLIRGIPRLPMDGTSASSSAQTSRGGAIATADRYSQSVVAGVGPSTTSVRSRRSDSHTLYSQPSGFEQPSQFHRPVNMLPAIPGLGVLTLFNVSLLIACRLMPSASQIQ